MFRRIILDLAIDFGPIIVFSILSERINFILATGIFVILTAIALIVGYIERKSWALFPLIVGLTVISFGLLTVVFDSPFFIIFKDTLYNGIFAIILLVGVFMKKGLLKPLFSDLFSMTDKGWYILSFRWAMMFTFLAIGNEIARSVLSPTDWVDYKIIATLTTAVFSLSQFFLARKERLPDSTAWGLRIR